MAEVIMYVMTYLISKNISFTYMADEKKIKLHNTNFRKDIYFTGTIINVPSDLEGVEYHVYTPTNFHKLAEQIEA